ncbi:histidine ammonia-lyase [Thermodesulfobacteriota bacterium]
MELNEVIVVGEDHISLEMVINVARGRAQVEISADEPFRKRLEQSRAHLHKALDGGVPVYGVTTGFGDSCGNRLSSNRTLDLGRNLLRYHMCGTGDPIGIEETRAAMMCRLVCLARGYSGVSLALLEQFADFLNAGITPVVPSQGSVGASGDLTPMAYIGAALSGEWEVRYRGSRISASDALRGAGLKPYTFGPKESLSIMNGTSIMTGIGTMAIEKSRALLDAAVAATALTLHGVAGHAHHFHQVLFEAKPFPGQKAVASRLRSLLASVAPPPEATDLDALQDPYSIRCAPHILGVLADSLDWISRWVEIEANSVSDNPIFHPESGEVLTGGNFYGGHLAMAMDALKVALASVADMSDRQIALMVDPRFSRGLPDGLVNIEGEERELHHGFKGMQITASALTAEALKNTMPAASFSRSTESHNQDKVSLGTIAARDSAAMCGMVAQVLAIHLMVSSQACEIRGGLDSRPGLKTILESIRMVVPTTTNDRPMDADFNRLAETIYDRRLFA